MLATVLQTARLSHSEILGSRVICTYPKLIAAYHVLHRLREPRHPPYALSYFPYTVFLFALRLARISSSYFQLYSNKVKSHLAIWFTLVWTKVHYLQFCLCQYVKDLFKWRVKNEEWRIHLSYSTLEWRITDSNRWPPACKAGALANWANPPFCEIEKYQSLLW